MSPEHVTTCIDEYQDYSVQAVSKNWHVPASRWNAPHSICKSPANTAAELYEQYTLGLLGLLDRHAPLIAKTIRESTHEWISYSYRMAKSLRQQYERSWRKNKSYVNRSRLHKQTAWCNRLINKDKSDYYRNLLVCSFRHHWPCYSSWLPLILVRCWWNSIKMIRVLPLCPPPSY